jgi:thioredoxin reductase (NADPH)
MRLVLRDVIIGGSGPAGYTAAIYAARAGLDTLVIEGHFCGGSLQMAGRVENFPGFADPVSGAALVGAMRWQAGRFGAQLRRAEVDGFDLRHSVSTVAIGGTTLRTRALILAMGSVSRHLNVPGEQELFGCGVSTSAKCDGGQFCGRDVAVIGGGDAAAEEALFLAPLARHVSVIHHRPLLRASKSSVARLDALDNVTMFTSVQVLGVLGDKQVRGLSLRHVTTGAASVLAVDAVFIAIGQRPRSQLLSGLVELDAGGYIKTRPGTTHTSVDGVFAAGNLIDRRYRQAVTAAASGCAAALDGRRWLAGTENASAPRSADVQERYARPPSDAPPRARDAHSPG